MIVRETATMIAAMAPVLDPLFYAFATGEAPVGEARPFAIIHESEATTRIVPVHDGVLPEGSERPFRRIVLTVHSALDGVGLTAAVATALAQANVACNMVAGTFHDHIFVPADDADKALSILQELQSEARRGGGLEENPGAAS